MDSARDRYLVVAINTWPRLTLVVLPTRLRAAHARVLAAERPSDEWPVHRTRWTSVNRLESSTSRVLSVGRHADGICLLNVRAHELAADLQLEYAGEVYEITFAARR